jgi:protein phosphatase 1 regulatory subunit 16A
MLHDLQNAPSDYLEYRDLHGATPLHIAAANGYLNVVEYLLDNHVSTEVIDDDQWQPIHAAACWGHLEVVEMLAQNGANIGAKTKNGETPFDICEDPEIKVCGENDIVWPASKLIYHCF